jgi:hypothetical protein
MALNWEKPEGWDAMARNTGAFMQNAAPLAFTWLEWCLILAVIQYVELRTRLWPLTALKFLLGAFLWGYFMAFVAGVEPQWLTRKQLKAWSTLAQWFISFSATAGMVYASYWFAQLFMKYPL